MKMQANPTPAVPAEQPVVCSTCGHEFVPAPRQSKKFCINCRWRAWNGTIHTCLHPHCTEKLRSDNTTGYCRKHHGHHKQSATAEMVGLYKGGLSVDEVSEQTQINRNIVARVIDDSGLMRTVGQGISLIKRGRPSPKSFDKWKAIELRRAGKSNQEIAQQLNRRSQGNIAAGFKSMGYPFKQYHSFGEVFDRAVLRDLKEMSDLTVPELALELGMRRGTLAPQVSTTRIPGQELDFDTARKIAQRRESLFFRLMSNAPANPTSGDKFGQSSIVLAFFPKLRDRYSFLREVLDRLAPTLRKNLEWKRHELEQHLCAQAMLEKAGKVPGDLFVRFLPWAPELMPLIAEKLQDLRGVDHGPLALKIIAGALRTTEAMIWTVINEAKRIRPIPPKKMRELILLQNRADGVVDQQQQAELEAVKAEVQRLRNQQRDERDERRDPLITLAVWLSLQGVKKGAMWAELYPGHRKKAAVDKTKKLFKRRSKDMQDEKSRLSALSETECQAEAEWARSQISPQAHGSAAAD
jgi:hypothetical protein